MTLTRREALTAGVAAATLTALPAVPAAAAVTVHVGSLNIPSRYPRRAWQMRRLVDVAPIWALQEQTDRAPHQIAPDGWRVHRPGRARSAAIIWHPRMDARDRGLFRVSTSRDPAFRAIVWVRFVIAARSLTVGSVHLAAFRWGARSRRRQAARCAQWLEAAPDRILIGDLNAHPSAPELAALRAVARARSAPTYGRAHLDHAWSPHTGPRLGRARRIPTVSDHDALWLPITLP